ncbi:DUF397 domain-containing protein [Yinghuangia sp. YIM S09857]|uniref:DUF397 domain-containing protein n=1 Tax=Yinghuangia sp. YIM S09857 TaxID=3436929 RepID=UPI003F532264
METAAESGLPRWRVSTASDHTNCVHVGRGRHTVLVRDSKRRSAGVLVVADAVWVRFVTALPQR